MKIKGVITRLVPGTRKDKSDARVFIRPDDPGVLSRLDGEQYVGSGEIPVFAAIEDLEVGQAHEIEIAGGGEG